MRKSKGRKSGKAESDKRDDAQNGDPERDSNEAAEEDEEDEEDDVKPKKSSKSSKRQSKSKDEDEDKDSEEEEESEEKPAKKSKKRKSSSKKGKGKSKKSKKTSESEDKSGDEGETKKSKRGRKAAASKEDEEDSDEDEVSKEEYEVEKIMDVYFKKNGEREFLVRWKGYSGKEDTWEPEAHLNCKDLINAYMKKCEEARNVTQRETRVNRKTTDRFILNSQEVGRKLSGRHKGKPRKTYFEDE